ncbi:hypothetical protein FGE05_20835 [Pseudomonas sp. ICMP22404]|nr:hypothetical protein FGE05_20835 [Pseudomonas sp. ICMP22404]
MESVARELAPAGARSGPCLVGAAAQPSGSKLPRHSVPTWDSLNWQRHARLCSSDRHLATPQQPSPKSHFSLLDHWRRWHDLLPYRMRTRTIGPE